MKVINWIIVIVLTLFVWNGSQAGYIYAKANMAQWLVSQAWQVSKQTVSNTKPWPWADTYPVAHMSMPKHKQSLYVLSGSTGRTLAFGPGHMSASVRPGEEGVSVIGGHRDTHFEFLKNVEIDDEVEVENIYGGKDRYRVISLQVADVRTQLIDLESDQSLIHMVTCYPFDAKESGGPLRYVVTAEKISKIRSKTMTL